MTLTRIQTIDTGAGGGTQVTTDIDGGLVIVSARPNDFLEELGVDGTAHTIAATPSIANFYYGNAEVLSDGRYAVYATSNFGYGAGTRVQILNRDGSEATGVINPMDEGGDRDGRGYTLAATAGGGFAFVWNDVSRASDTIGVDYPPAGGNSHYDSAAGYDVRYSYFDANGVRIGSSSVADAAVDSIDGASTSRRYGDQYVNDTATLAGGQTAFVYYDTRAVGQPSGGFHNEGELSLQISSPGGGTTAPVKVDIGPYNEQGGDYPQTLTPSLGANVIALPDGTLAVTWIETHYHADASVYGGYAFDGWAGYVRYYDASGNALTGPVTIASIADEGGYSWTPHIYADALPDGRIVFAYNSGQYGANGNGHIDLHFGEIGALGSSVSSSLINAPTTNTQFYNLYDLAVRSDGTVDLVYQDPNDANHTVIERYSAGVGVNGSTLSGGGTLNGGTLDDLLIGAASGDTLNGGGGNDTAYGNGGGDRINGGAGNDKLYGNEGDDVLTGSTGGDAIYGGNGSDTASYAASAAAVTIDLASGTASGGDAAGDTLFSIENLIGSAYNDVLTGDGGNNVLTGGAGNDTLTGGAGIDTANYAAAASAVTVSLAAAGVQNTGGGGLDTLDGIENLTGSAYADALTGDGGDNVLSGGSGNDNLTGGAGNDTLDGGAGFDRAIYSDAASGVTIDLNLTAAQATGSGSETLVNIEAVLGSNYDDRLTGDAHNNELKGAGGNDTLIDGGGNDQLNGGSGIDTADYSSAGVGIHADLSNAAAQNTQVGSDTLTSIENLLGSAFNDILTGSNVANVLSGGNGIDRLDGGLGKDTLTGGAGTDRFFFTTTLGSANIDTITDFTAGQDKMYLDHNVFTGLTAGALAAGAFDTGAAASDTDDRIIYNSATGALLFDRDGTGGAHAVQFATLSTGLSLSASSFMVT